jgi:hypothetical protein
MHNSIEPTDYIQRLRMLPTEKRPPYNWQEFRRRSQQTNAPARVVTDWRPLAGAATLLIFVCAIAVWGRFEGSGRHLVADSGAIEDGAPTSKQSTASTSGAVASWRKATNGTTALPNDRKLAAGEAVGPTPSAAAGQTSGESAIATRRSRAIESWLAALPRERAVVRVGTRAAVAGLEDQIAQVDDLMTSMRIEGSSGDRLADLQRERLRLVGSLAQVRYAEVVASASP